VAKKKQRRRHSAVSGEHTQERRRERLEARREARAAALAAQRRVHRRRALTRAAMVGGLTAALALVLFVQMRPEPTPDEIDGHRVEKFEETGIGEHVTGTVDYDSIPPTHGPHAAVPATCGVHAQQIANEALVHSLEHGAIGLLYLPSVPLEDIRALERIVRSYDVRVFSAPYSPMQSAFTMVSWGELMRLDSLDTAAIRGYIGAFRGKGPEDRGCPNTSDRPFRPPNG
jgi:hypothetical protein